MKMEMFEEIREIANSKIPVDLRLHQAAVQVLAYNAGITKRIPEMDGGKMDSKGWLWIGKGAGIRVRAAKSGQAVEIQSHFNLDKIQGGVAGVEGLATFVPLAWLGKTAWTAVHRQVRVLEADDLGQYTVPAATDIPYIVKAVMVWGHSNTREMFLKCMQNRALMFNIRTDDGSFSVAPYHYTQNTGFVRAEQNMKGLKGAGWPSTATSFNVIREDDGLWLFEDPSKTNERVTKIYWNTEGLAIGTWNMMIAIDQIMVDEDHKDAVVLQQEVDNAFCSGTAYSKGLFRFAGPGRFITKRIGCKMTVCSPFQLDGIMDDTILVNKSVAKGGLNMILAHLGIMTQQEQVEAFQGMDGDAATSIAIQMLEDAGKIRTITAKYCGVDVKFRAVCTREVVYATNLYTLYGCQYAADQTEIEGDYEAASMMASYYLDKQRELVQNSTDEARRHYNLSKIVMDDIEAKRVVKKAPKTSFSIREMTNFFWSYCVVEVDGKMIVDTKPLHGLVDQLLGENARTENETQREMHRVVKNGYAGLPRLSLEQFRCVLDEIFTVKSMVAVPGFEDEEYSVPIQVPMSGWMRSQPGLSGLSDEEFCYKWKQLVSKGKKGSKIAFWPGLGGKGFVVEIQGHDMFIPSANFLRKDIMPVDKSTYNKDTNPECMFGESMQTIMSLFMAARASRTMEGFEWGFTSAQHLIRMNSAMFEDRLNRMSVAGTYLTMAPRFWDASKNCQQRITALLAPAGKVCYSKDPVLFDKAVTGVINKNTLPARVFGTLTPSDLFAMKSVAFISTELMLQQENDTDGDLCCIRFNLDVPLYTEQWRYMDVRVGRYVADERKFVMGARSWKKYTFDELSIGVDGNKQAKENIGLMSSNLFQHAHLLENAVLTKQLSLFWAKMFWNMYGYIVQYEAMRQIKHADGGGGGQSLFYSTTAVSVVLRGDHKMLVHGDEELGGGGFLENIASHYSGWQATPSNIASLEKAAADYCNSAVRFNLKAYKKDEDYPVGGNRTGRTVGMMKMESIPLAVDINNGKCEVHQYRWFNALQRGYYRHVEENRLGVAHANAGKHQLDKHGVRTPRNGLDVFFGHLAIAKELAYQGVYFKPVELMSLAYRLDDRVKNGWRAQHTFAGANNCVSDEESVLAIRWMEMVDNAPDAAEKVFWKRAFKAVTRELISSEPVVMDPVQCAIDGLGQLPDNIVYPGEKK